MNPQESLIKNRDFKANFKGRNRPENLFGINIGLPGPSDYSPKQSFT